MQAVVGLDTSTDEKGPRSPECLPDFVLQVAERSEYLDAAARLMDYEYVHECYKYDRDVVFVVVKRERMQKPYLRTVCVMIHNQNLMDHRTSLSCQIHFRPRMILWTVISRPRKYRRGIK